MAEIVFDQISKSYGDGYAAIRNLDMTIRDSEFLVLVGPSGCGKSTALRMIAGLEEITDGRLTINGAIVNDLAPRDRDIAMVFQSYALYPHLTVAENIGFGLRVRGLDKADIARKVQETAKLLELEDYLARKPAQLSGGQRQRVAMGRALARSPQAFLMDEPLSNLDARLRGQMRAEIARMQKMSGITTVYVTHDQVEAMTMGDRVAVMKSGVLQQLGTPRSLYDQPANLFVASFMGSPAMNLLATDLFATENGPEARFGQASILFSGEVLAERPRIAAAAGRAVVLGIRPEAFQPVDAGGLTGTVAFVEDLGANLLVHVDVEAADRLKSLSAEEDDVTLSAPRLRVIIDATRRVKIGERLSLAADPARIHVFDAATEAAIRA
ncbi:sn-glycerol-3-phosphate ABC transporter ATP-binding protein UgpC (plasmid) [Rhizobium ruizarguesonis]|jgi:multiple sugar transport system ATP-binding protein|uniref:Sn-glycerol-3-phosphate ABC transporter ATP-binding protein UgpC n=1 Tax=Rhizobium ruizarguesonis TaxID=2081791 RepID=A0AB38HVS1_9HYPH|nr:sn-glycerol-3-phosphate ABC transporter ATP-binding protein UgpC [Rhizobium ruizarguesonis]MBY5830307.1 sn-glycerol-3-phosphate ABC transporter ATP-binding protein UgpC [Rhizobium leguminosarum]NKJ74495.1 sn-glycerol-3-phosphate ABC transporter ATP-binding protein UgpC [Rhizobium leguminosarum bv. viciae]QIO48831.1 sn-glycerol-3-phosphate ABC transporter ATP-binding protein UgpC [Rhizobium leguminosarum bv. trifolii]MBC2807459.1 sn-glycerol-3-phosphate ABC transporter ATP-binding protein Ugp